MNIVIASDAWKPQLNGVVRTLSTTVELLQQHGHRVKVVEPSHFRTIPLPFYREIRLACNASARKVGALIQSHQPCAVHIATEGPIGWATRRYCLNQRLPFTTSYHTNFPEYLLKYFRLPQSWSYGVLRRFHRHAAAIMVSTQSMQNLLRKAGFEAPLKLWSRGVDTELFRPRPKSARDKPLCLYVGRIAVEKNLEAFLKSPVDCRKRVVGRGPALEKLRAAFPDAEFPGPKYREELAEEFSQADVFVFPSRTDTFGLVMLEALACGVPVAAFPVPGPIDVIGDRQEIGCLHEDLSAAIETALHKTNPQACRQHALQYTWQRCTEQFSENLALPAEFASDLTTPIR